MGNSPTDITSLWFCWFFAVTGPPTEW